MRDEGDDPATHHVRRTVGGLVRPPGLDTRAVPARRLEALPGRARRPAGDADRQRQDPGCVRGTAVAGLARSACTQAQAWRTGSRAYPRALDQPVARTGERHHACAARADRSARPAVDRGDAHRRRQCARQATVAQRPVRCTRHHARIARPAAVVCGNRRTIARTARRRRRRVARTAGQQARRVAATLPGALAGVVADAAHMGTVGDARQPRASTRRPAAARARCTDHRRRQAAFADAGNAAAGGPRAFRVGGPPGPVAIATRGRAPAGCAQHVAVRQHALAGGAVAQGLAVGVAGRPRHAGTASRLHRPETPACRRTGIARWQRALRGRDLQPGPGRRLPGGGPGHPDRQPEGHGATAATRRARASSSRRSRPHPVRADPRAGTGRVRRRAQVAQRRQGRGASAATPVAGCPGAALRDPGARGWLRRRCVVRGSPRHACLRRPRCRHLAGRARLHRAGRQGAGALPRLPPRDPRRRRHVSRRRSQARIPAPAVDRHHHQRRPRVRAVRQGRAPRFGRGKLHRSPASARPLPVRRQDPGAHPAEGHDRLRAPGQAQRRHRAALAGQPHAAVQHAGRRSAGHAGGPARHARTARRRADAGHPGAAVRTADTRHLAGRTTGHARGLAPVPVSVRRPRRA